MSLAVNEYSNLNLVLFSVVLDECFPDTFLVSADSYSMIYFQNYEPFSINSMSYIMLLLCGIILYQLPVSFI